MSRRLFDCAQQRDEQHRRRLIVVVDGNNHQLDRIHAVAHAHGVRIDIIKDVTHVLEYLRNAAEDLRSVDAPPRSRRLCRLHRP